MNGRNKVSRIYFNDSKNINRWIKKNIGGDYGQYINREGH